MILKLSVSPFGFVNLHIIETLDFDIFLLDQPLIITKCPSLSQGILLILKSALSNISIATSTFFWLVFTCIFFPTFYFNLAVALWYVSCKQHTLKQYLNKKVDCQSLTYA